MSKDLTKEDVIQNKKEAIKSINKLLESYINDPAGKHLKKANLISHWLKDYARFIDFEEKFEPTKNISYKRGNIVKLHFGFNIGSEYGGLHYGVVLDIKNSHNSPVITVIPLTSMKESKEIHNNSVDLGNEIYRLLKLKYDTISKSLKDESEQIENALSVFNIIVNLAEATFKECDNYEEGSTDYVQKLSDTKSYLDAADKLRESFEKKQKHNASEQEYLSKIGEEISRMKEGSVALVNQVTTVSKIRIFDPRNLKGVLAGVSLSEESMEKINQKMQELYIF